MTPKAIAALAHYTTLRRALARKEPGVTQEDVDAARANYYTLAAERESESDHTGDAED
jgi:hypothetical protein